MNTLGSTTSSRTINQATINKVNNGWIIYVGAKTLVAYTYNEMLGIIEEQFNILPITDSDGKVKKVEY